MRVLKFLLIVEAGVMLVIGILVAGSWWSKRAEREFYRQLLAGWVESPTQENNGNGATLANTSIPTPVEKPWILTVGGDIMLDRNVRQSIAKRGRTYPFEAIRSELNGDIVLANLEGPFTDSTKYAVSGGALIFTFDPALAPVLKDVGFTTLSLANNHTLNYGQAGLDNTRRVLREAGLDFFGDPRNAHGFGIVKTVAGHRLAFIGYHGLVVGLETILADIREAKAQELFVIVMPHWGAEYQLGIQPRLQEQAHQLVDAGADLIIGAHPHVVEPIELYNDKLIFYSLGNFLFDQYFSEDTLEGLMLQFTLRANSTDIELQPIRTTDQQVRLLTDERRDAMLERLAKDSAIPTELRTQIKTGHLSWPLRNGE